MITGAAQTSKMSKQINNIDVLEETIKDYRENYEKSMDKIIAQKNSLVSSMNMTGGGGQKERAKLNDLNKQQQQLESTKGETTELVSILARKFHIPFLTFYKPSVLCALEVVRQTSQTNPILSQQVSSVSLNLPTQGEFIGPTAINYKISEIKNKNSVHEVQSLVSNYFDAHSVSVLKTDNTNSNYFSTSNGGQKLGGNDNLSSKQVSKNDQQSVISNSADDYKYKKVQYNIVGGYYAKNTSLQKLSADNSNGMFPTVQQLLLPDVLTSGVNSTVLNPDYLAFELLKKVTSADILFSDGVNKGNFDPVAKYLDVTDEVAPLSVYKFTDGNKLQSVTVTTKIEVKIKNTLTNELYSLDNNGKFVGTVDEVLFYAADYLGERLTKKTSLEVNNTIIDEYTSYSYVNYRNTELPLDKVDVYKRCVGHAKQVVGHADIHKMGLRRTQTYEHGPQVPSVYQRPIELFVPLLFWFKDISNSLFVATTNLLEKKVKIELESVDNLFGVKLPLQIVRTFTHDAKLFDDFEVSGGDGSILLKIENQLITLANKLGGLDQYNGVGLVNSLTEVTSVVENPVTKFIPLSNFAAIPTLEVSLLSNIISLEQMMQEVMLDKVQVNLVRIHKSQTQQLSGVNTVDVSLPLIKFCAEEFHISAYPDENYLGPNRLENWHLQGKVINCVDVDTLWDNPTCIKYEMPVLKNLGLTAHGVSLYNKEFSFDFYNNWTQYSTRNLNSKNNLCAFMNFNLIKEHNPSSYVNLSRLRECFINCTLNDQFVGSKPGNECVVHQMINKNGVLDFEARGRSNNSNSFVLETDGYKTKCLLVIDVLTMNFLTIQDGQMLLRFVT